jgi:UDP-N-acetylmuramate--alanine ligase
MGRHVHFIGIGGTGLSAIATVLLERGDTVSGSDRQVSVLTTRLEEMGANIFLGHKSENVLGADIVVRSSAVRDDNPEVQAAIAQGIPVLKRLDFLPDLTSTQKTIAIAGTHGKTTTTSMIAMMLTALDLDPSYVIGGVPVDLGRNAHAGKGDCFVIEADEYDHMFFGLNPWIAIVTNVEYDHPDCFPTPVDFLMAFETFSDHVLDGGAMLASIDNEGSAFIYSRALAAGRRSYAYSIRDPKANYYAGEPHLNSLGGYTFDLYKQGDLLASNVELHVPGLHNVSNALAALGVADLLALPIDRAQAAIREYRGTGRRFELRGVVNGITVIDDYAHHPTEIKATLAAAKLRFPGSRIWAVWQPHTYSRTRTLLEDFRLAFNDADQVLVSEVFPAREQPPLDGFSSRQVADAIQYERRDRPGSVHFIPGLMQIGNFLLSSLKPGDVIFVLSAGDADQVSNRLLMELA